MCAQAHTHTHTSQLRGCIGDLKACCVRVNERDRDGWERKSVTRGREEMDPLKKGVKKTFGSICIAIIPLLLMEFASF